MRAVRSADSSPVLGADAGAGLGVEVAGSGGQLGFVAAVSTLGWFVSVRMA